jgi:hypothetical protein
MQSPQYERLFGEMLERVSSAATDPDVALVPFWPIRGSAYDRELLVIGRSVNGWVEDWTARQLADPATRRSAIEQLRADAEPANSCRMRWVTDLWGARDGYSTRRSAFWRVVRGITLADPTRAVDPERWSSRLVWTNLYKVSPAAGWNPGADLQRVQRASAIELLTMEIEEFAPRRVLALTGSWIEPFVEGIGLSLTKREGLVEGVGHVSGRGWVVAKHPMGKPERAFVDEVLRAYAELELPLR